MHDYMPTPIFPLDDAPLYSDPYRFADLPRTIDHAPARSRRTIAALIGATTLACALVASAAAARADVIEPRAVQLNLVSAAEMSRQCRQAGLRPNCEGMAAWDKEFRQCVIWVRAGDWSHVAPLVAHELTHCQEGQFHG